MNDKQATGLAGKIDQAYKDYLKASENKRTTPIREDAFINGLVVGLQMANKAGQILEEINK